MPTVDLGRYARINAALKAKAFEWTQRLKTQQGLTCESETQERHVRTGNMAHKIQLDTAPTTVARCLRSPVGVWQHGTKKSSWIRRELRDEVAGQPRGRPVPCVTMASNGAFILEARSSQPQFPSGQLPTVASRASKLHRLLGCRLSMG